MNRHLGYTLDNHTILQVVNGIDSVKTLVEDYDIEISWFSPKVIYIPLYRIEYLSDIISRYILSKKIKGVDQSSFSGRVDGIDLGLSGKYKGLIYLSLDDLSSKKIRNNYYFVDEKLKVSSNALDFIPHIPIARLSRDINELEIVNFRSHLKNIYRQSKVDSITFSTDILSYIKYLDGKIISKKLYL